MPSFNPFTSVASRNACDSTHHHNLLAPGNYEWPFELTLPGDTPESVEGLYQTGITYFLKATISRGKLAKNHHAYKRLRIIRTLEPAALEFNHAMSVENIWPNKIEYSVVIPQKAIVFGSNIPLEMRFTPLLKGLEMGLITVKLIEIQELSVSSHAAAPKSHKRDRDVTTWTIEVNRDEHWQDNIEETGQEGWLVTKDLPLPKRLTKCIQDCNVHGIKIRHKVKLTVALKNPDGHISELRATLPVTIFISPNMPLDEEGNLVSQQPSTTSERTQADSAISNMAPPGYGQHVLDQLYEDVDPSGIMTPSNIQSGLNSPFYSQSRAGSSENLAVMAQHGAVPPAALSSRLQNVSLNQSSRNSSFLSSGSRSETTTPFHYHHDDEHPADWSQPHSTELSRRTSEEDHSHPHSHNTTPPEPEHSEHLDMAQLSKVPSYTTATRTPLPRTPSYSGTIPLPDYQTAISAPGSPTQVVFSDPMSTISEAGSDGPHTGIHENGLSRGASPSRGNRAESMGFHFLPHAPLGDAQAERRIRIMQSRVG
ncbi:hypothetical protein DL770_011727 [Monosporascus sp. CRB-9-2]|nr:hypothetical protein DL770_011727 [Monosporascus sp. CRB-9-2]